MLLSFILKKKQHPDIIIYRANNERRPEGSIFHQPREDEERRFGKLHRTPHLQVPGGRADDAEIRSVHF